MSATDGKSTVCVRPKRKRPMLETNDGELHESPSNHADDFPTAFNFRSNRHVRRRLCTQLAGMTTMVLDFFKTPLYASCSFLYLK